MASAEGRAFWRGASPERTKLASWSSTSASARRTSSGVGSGDMLVTACATGTATSGSRGSSSARLAPSAAWAETSGLGGVSAFTR